MSIKLTRQLVEYNYLHKVAPYLIENTNGCHINSKASKAMPYASIAITGDTTGKKYPNMRGHVLSYLYHNNLLERDGLYVLHSCDVKSCCNPKHLRLGTASENMLDMYARNLASKVGIRSNRASLTEKQVIAIYTSRQARKILAEKYAVTTSVVAQIQNKVSWRNLTNAVDELMIYYFDEVPVQNNLRLGRV